jgi:hypothetical protein
MDRPSFPSKAMPPLSTAAALIKGRKRSGDEKRRLIRLRGNDVVITAGPASG